jgi:hypothetical protein
MKKQRLETGFSHFETGFQGLKPGGAFKATAGQLDSSYVPGTLWANMQTPNMYNPTMASAKTCIRRSV